MTPDYTPWIVCAAMRMKDGLVVPGARHYSPDMRAVLRRLYPCSLWRRLLLPQLFNLSFPHVREVAEQGFIDQRGQFHNRQDAWRIAVANGQVRNRVGGDTRDGGTLFSESLY